MRNIYDILHKIIISLLLVGMISMTVIVVVQIITRYVFFHSLPWSEELSRYIFAWIIFIGACVGVKENNQIAIDLIDTLIMDGLKKPLAIIQWLLQMAAAGVMLYASIDFISLGGIGQRSPSMHIPMYLIYICIPVGFTLLFVELTIKFVACLRIKAEREQK